MTTVKVRFRPTHEGAEGEILYQIYHGHQTKVIHAHHLILPDEWNPETRMVTISCDRPRKAYIMALREKIHSDIELLKKISRNLEMDSSSFCCRDIALEYEKYNAEYTLSNYMGNIISKLKKNGKLRTSETYRAALNSFRKYYGGNDIRLDNFSTTLMEGYECWLRERGLTPNTVSFYMRILRATYNRAVEENAIDNKFPFKHVYTGIGKTQKRAVQISTIRKICSLNLKHNPRLDFARDMFMMSFYFRGMSFVDMAFLRKSDLHNGYITYRRRKTGQQLHIKWTLEMQHIIEKYPENKSIYLLPLIRSHTSAAIYTYRNLSYNINRSLKEIARIAGLSLPLTLYVARHSWASAAKSQGIPLSVISEGMGHDSESTTRIYLASLDASAVDRANSVILKSLMSDVCRNSSTCKSAHQRKLLL